MQGAGKHMSGAGGTAFLMTSGPNLAVKQNPAARLLAWAITNTSNLAQAVRRIPSPKRASLLSPHRGFPCKCTYSSYVPSALFTQAPARRSTAQ